MPLFGLSADRRRGDGRRGGQWEGTLIHPFAYARPDRADQAVAICADLDHNVFNPSHTDPRVAAALQDTYWYPLSEWTQRAPRP